MVTDMYKITGRFKMNTDDITRRIKDLLPYTTRGERVITVGEGDEHRFVTLDIANKIHLITDDFLEDEGWILNHNDIEWIRLCSPENIQALIDRIEEYEERFVQINNIVNKIEFYIKNLPISKNP